MKEPTQTTPLDRESRTLLVSLLAESREEVARADSKAATLLGIIGITIGVVLAGIISGEWSPLQLATGFEIAWWAGATTSLGCLAALGLALWPQMVHKSDRMAVAFFGHICQFESQPELRSAIVRMSARDPDARSLDQVLAISQITGRKYRRIQAALLLASASTLLCLGSVILNLAA